ncbi:hypothetical protein KCP78_03605 [Salmonella enterica subsp. enterica]|nr:hypothetical protein KCP78_03605 [Salmonella enterica subsp. enterica]
MRLAYRMAANKRLGAGDSSSTGGRRESNGICKRYMTLVLKLRAAVKTAPLPPILFCKRWDCLSGVLCCFVENAGKIFLILLKAYLCHPFYYPQRRDDGYLAVLLASSGDEAAGLCGERIYCWVWFRDKY